MNEFEAQKWLEGFEWDDSEETSEALSTICNALQEYPKYKVLGTVTECTVARKLVPMKVTIGSDDLEYLQERMSRKLHKGPMTNKESAYDDGILACKSILSEYRKMMMKNNK